MKSQAPNENANAKRQFVVSEGANAVSVHKRPQALKVKRKAAPHVFWEPPFSF
tara:strand:+ start:2628 stop:2786 length:159 start_codon:yes stop_codon:yes gene_type:complete